jgi:uncharacterized membrane protein YcfT
MEHEQEFVVSRFSAPGMIAWMSLFLLTFAIGGIADQQWHKFALQAGAVGLISAVGLGSLEKARRVRQKVLRDRALRERLDRRIGLEEWEVVNGSQMRVTPPSKQTGSSSSESPQELVQT